MSDKNKDGANSGNESDGDFDPTADMLVNDFDDEGTLAEEEALETEGTTKEEIDALEEEGNIPIEELLKRYYSGAMPPTGEEDDDDDDEPEEESVSSSSGAGGASAAVSASSSSTSQADPTQNSAPTSATDKDPAGQAPSKPKNTTNYLESDYSSSEDEYEDANVATWKRSIQVGDAFQARIPPLLSDTTKPASGASTAIKADYKHKFAGEKLLWKPTSYLSSRQIDEYLIEYAKVSLNDDDILGDISLLTLPEGVHIKDDEQALFVLFRCQYNITEALQMHELRNEPRAPIKEMMSPWSEEECRAFENGMRSYGKDFFQIKQNRIPTRTVGETVEFYYFWKKTERHDIYVNKYEKEKKKYALHPGLTDYMDRFLDEQENLSSGGGVQSAAAATAAALQAMSSQVSSSDLNSALSGNAHHRGAAATSSSSSSANANLPQNLFMGNSSLTITAHHSPVKTISVSGDRTQTILINKEKGGDKHHHHHHHHQQYHHNNHHGMSIMAGNRKPNQSSGSSGSGGGGSDVTTTILLGNNSVKDFTNFTRVSSTSGGSAQAHPTNLSTPSVSIYKVPTGNNSRFQR